MVDFPRQVRSLETPWDFLKTVERLLGSFGISFRVLVAFPLMV